MSCRWRGELPLLETVATIFAVNRDQERPLTLEGDVRSFVGYEVDEHLVLEHEGAKATNTARYPDNVTPHRGSNAAVLDGELTALLPRLS